MATPTWVSKDLFQTAVRSFFKNPNIDVLNFTSDYAVPPGENFTSDLFKTTITYIDKISNKQDSLSVIVKCGNEDGGTKEAIAKDLNLFERESEMFARVFPAIYEILGFEKYGYKLSILGDEALERGFRAMRKKLGGFHVLNHGDLWVNNMMFSYNKDGKVKDTRLVDFQMNIFTSPAIDLHYFIATSTTLETKHQYIEIILDHYYAQLLATLTKLQYSLERVPSREQFRRDYNYRAFYGLMGAATVLPLVKATAREDASFENIIKDDSKEGFRYDAYNNQRYRKHMEFLLPYYDSLGILD